VHESRAYIHCRVQSHQQRPTVCLLWNIEINLMVQSWGFLQNVFNVMRWANQKLITIRESEMIDSSNMIRRSSYFAYTLLMNWMARKVSNITSRKILLACIYPQYYAASILFIASKGILLKARCQGIYDCYLPVVHLGTCTLFNPALIYRTKEFLSYCFIENNDTADMIHS
jgi:hypothetical protein